MLLNFLIIHYLLKELMCQDNYKKIKLELIHNDANTRFFTSTQHWQ